MILFDLLPCNDYSSEGVRYATTIRISVALMTVLLASCAGHPGRQAAWVSPSPTGRLLSLPPWLIRIRYMPPLEVRSDIIRLQLSSGRNTYRVGEPIMIAVHVINASHHTWFFRHFPAPAISSLVVDSAPGTRIAAQSPRGYMKNCPPWYEDPACCHIPKPNLPLPAGGAYAADDRCWKPGSSLIATFDIRDWGYYLSTPGTYTIRAIPIIKEANRENAEHGLAERFTTDGVTIASNTLTVTVIP